MTLFSSWLKLFKSYLIINIVSLDLEVAMLAGEEVFFTFLSPAFRESGGH